MSTAPGSDSVGTGEIKKTRIIKKILSKMAFASNYSAYILLVGKKFYFNI